MESELGVEVESDKKLGAQSLCRGRSSGASVVQFGRFWPHGAENSKLLMIGISFARKVRQEIQQCMVTVQIIWLVLSSTSCTTHQIIHFHLQR